MHPIDEEKKQKTEYLTKYSEMLWNYNIHTEKLTHEVFYVITAMIVAIWTITNQYLNSIFQKSAMYILTGILALFGMYLIYKFQHSNAEIRIIMNKIRLKTGIQNITVKINDKEEKIFPCKWEKYILEEIKDICIPREGIKSTGCFSWWMAYKWFLLSMMLGSICFLVLLFVP